MSLQLPYSDRLLLRTKRFKLSSIAHFSHARQNANGNRAN